MEESLFCSQGKGVAYGVGAPDTPLYNIFQIDKCERIIFRDKTLDFIFELPYSYYKDIETIIVNGVKFERVKEN